MKIKEIITKATNTVINNYINILGIILIILKLLNIFDISWWIILLPFYLGFLIVGVLKVFIE